MLALLDEGLVFVQPVLVQLLQFDCLVPAQDLKLLLQRYDPIIQLAKLLLSMLTFVDELLIALLETF